MTKGDSLESQTMVVRNLSVPDSFFRSLFYYPLHTLQTNRILDTVISRKVAKRNMGQDLSDMFRIGGLRVIYAGVIPCYLTSLAFKGSLTNDFYNIKRGDT